MNCRLGSGKLAKPQVHRGLPHSGRVGDAPLHMSEGQGRAPAKEKESFRKGLKLSFFGHLATDIAL